MKTLAILLFLGQIVFAQDVKTPSSFTEALRLQMLDPQKKELSDLLHPSLSYGHSNGKIENKEQVVEVLLTGASDFSALNFDNIIIEELGKNAIVRYDFKGILIDKNRKEVTLNIKVLMVLVKNKGSWSLLARQGFRLPS